MFLVQTMSKPIKTVTVSEELYLAYRESHLQLMALEAHGVDNWEGYSYAMAEFFDGEEDDDES